MLHTDTVTNSTLELLKKICAHPHFDDFFLVGGTSLSLQIGHRISIDLDFFSLNNFNPEKLKTILIKEFNAQIISIDSNAITGTINDVKFDFITHQYPLLKPIVSVDNIRISSIEDIAAMKLNAICNRGTKKDFVDVFFLLKQLTLQQQLELTNKKYPNHIDVLTLKSLVYFEDADIQPDCKMIIPIAWSEIKAAINKEVLYFL